MANGVCLNILDSRSKSAPVFSVAGVILAGGEGRRIGGEDKGLLIFRDRPMISWTVDQVRPLVNELVISCNRNQSGYATFGVTTLSDGEDSFLGPLAGINAAMQALAPRCSHLLVLPCDTPFIGAEVLKKLLLSAQQAPRSICFLVSGEQAHFLHAVIPAEYADRLREDLNQGVRAVYRWYKQFPILEVEADAASLVNFNHADQFSYK